LLGAAREELGGSEWLALRAGLEAGLPPRVDLEHERRLLRLLREGVADGRIESAHDVSSGGLAVALAECGIAGPERIGARVALAEAMRPEALLFGESTGRVIAATADPQGLLAAARACGVPAALVGETGGERLHIAGGSGTVWIDVPLAELHEVWSRALPRRMEAA
jgi:phosphoribosylformylglycinamidine synthase